MSDTQQQVVPERYKYYRAIVNYHKPPDRQPSPAQGQEVIVFAAWMMEEDELFPGEFAFLVEEPEGFSFWLPQRDLRLLEQVEIRPYFGVNPTIAVPTPGA